MFEKVEVEDVYAKLKLLLLTIYLASFCAIASRSQRHPYVYQKP